MNADVTTPAGLAEALLRGAVTPERIAKLLRLLRRRPRAFVDATLAALPAPARAQVEAAAARVVFRG